VFDIRIQTDDFDLSVECATLRAQHRNIGALVSFVGIVRDVNDGANVSAMTLEHYPGMTEKALTDIVNVAAQRWPLLAATVIHRVGRLLPTDQIVLVVVAAAHRGDAFQGCEFIMDYLKSDAPFWKKETTPDGSRWVDARSADYHAQQRWSKPS
jgi:molybdopterin synthase catalytic subunit